MGKKFVGSIAGDERARDLCGNRPSRAHVGLRNDPSTRGEITSSSNDLPFAGLVTEKLITAAHVYLSQGDDTPDRRLAKQLKALSGEQGNRMKTYVDKLDAFHRGLKELAKGKHINTPAKGDVVYVFGIMGLLQDITRGIDKCELPTAIQSDIAQLIEAVGTHIREAHLDDAMFLSRVAARELRDASGQEKNGWAR